jgi:hypothetical protein
MLMLELLIPLSTVYRPNGEVMDKSTPLGYGDYIYGINNRYVAQSFKPKLPILSKVKLGLWKQANMPGNFTVSIREEFKGDDFVSKIVSIDEVPYMSNSDWVAIDFQDTNVTPNKNNYIVFTSDD